MPDTVARSQPTPGRGIRPRSQSPSARKPRTSEPPCRHGGGGGRKAKPQPVAQAPRIARSWSREVAEDVGTPLENGGRPSRGKIAARNASLTEGIARSRHCSRSKRAKEGQQKSHQLAATSSAAPGRGVSAPRISGGSGWIRSRGRIRRALGERLPTKMISGGSYHPCRLAVHIPKERSHSTNRIPASRTNCPQAVRLCWSRSMRRFHRFVRFRPSGVSTSADALPMVDKSDWVLAQTSSVLRHHHHGWCRNHDTGSRQALERH